MSTDTTLCDCCGREVEVDESQTCYCGETVCDACMESSHYTCADKSEDS